LLILNRGQQDYLLNKLGNYKKAIKTSVSVYSTLKEGANKTVLGVISEQV
jgi:hypothetical protein